jgi:signal transduction histidine kinase
MAVAMAAAMMGYRIAKVEAPDGIILQIEGQLVGDAAGVLREEIERARARGTLTLDLAGVSFADDASALELHTAANRDASLVGARGFLHLLVQRVGRAPHADEESVRTLIDLSSDAIVIHERGTIVHANPRARVLLGVRNQDQLLGHPMSRYILPSPAAALWKAALPGPARSLVLVRRPDGELTVEAAEVRLVLDGVETVATQLFTLNDNPPDSTPEADRLDAAATLAAGLAHEVNNPLVCVAMALDHLAAKLGGQRDRLEGKALRVAREDLEMAREAVGTLVRVVRDFKAFIRPDRPFHLVPVDPRASVERAVRLAACTVQAVAKVETSLEDVPPIRGLESAITQVVLNLLINAAEGFNPVRMPRNRITVRLTSADGAVVIEVGDNGRGIAPEIRDRLFDPLFTTKADRGGTGLGLSICRALVASLGGTISVDSVPGEGSTFRVRLPYGRPVP